MAIEKTQGAPKVEWTRSSIASVGIAALLVVLSLLLGWFAFSNWRFKSNLLEGYQEYDRGHAANAKKSMEAALSWRPAHTGARQLLAKLLCDEGKLSDARAQYGRLLAQGYNAPQVHIGLGVLGLKEVESLDKPKAIETMVAEASGEFRKAAGVPEAEIGQGHCELVLARKLNDPSHVAKAQALFEKVQTAMEKSKEFRASVTRDGLVDYYTGLGKALASSDKGEGAAAAAAFRACFQYTPTWTLPMANILAVEARRIALSSDGNDALLKAQGDLNAVRTQGRNVINAERDSTLKAVLREQWLAYSLALAQAWGRAGNLTELQNVIRDTQSVSGFDQRLEPALLEAQIRTDLAAKEDPNVATQESYVTKATGVYNELIPRIPTDDANKERRATALNNLAWTLAWRGGYQSSENLYTQAMGKLNEALKLYPEDYVLNRNMAVVLKRFRKAPSDPGPYVEKCRSLASAKKEWADDFEKLQKVMGTK
jgi:tetratricopeptide (TPR) repeat protein